MRPTELLTHRGVVAAEDCDESGRLSLAGWAQVFDEASLLAGARSEGQLVLELLESAGAGDGIEVWSRRRDGELRHRARRLGRGVLLAKAALPVASAPAPQPEAKDHEPAPLVRRVFRPWHRGQAGHVNIQNHAQAIDDAARVELLERCAPSASVLDLRPLSQRLRFEAELHPGDGVSLVGSAAEGEGDRLTFRGRMVRHRDGRTACRWDCRYGVVDEAGASVIAPWTEPARSVAEHDPLRGVEGSASSGWIPSYRGTVEPRESDRRGAQTSRGLWDLLTRALWIVQNRLGCHRDQLAESGLRAGASLFDVECLQTRRLGDPLEIRSALLGRGRTSLRLVQEVRRRGEVVVRSRYVLAFFDPATGRSTPPPEAVSRRVLELLEARA